MLAVQALAVICILFWGVCSTFLLLWLVNKVTPLRMEPKDELLGADVTEHNIKPPPAAADAITRITESQISQRSRPTPPHDDRMAGLYRTYFSDELADRSKPPARDNPAYEHDERS